MGFTILGTCCWNSQAKMRSEGIVCQPGGEPLIRRGEAGHVEISKDAILKFLVTVENRLTNFLHELEEIFLFQGIGENRTKVVIHCLRAVIVSTQFLMMFRRERGRLYRLRWTFWKILFNRQFERVFTAFCRTSSQDRDISRGSVSQHTLHVDMKRGLVGESPVATATHEHPANTVHSEHVRSECLVACNDLTRTQTTRFSLQTTHTLLTGRPISAVSLLFIFAYTVSLSLVLYFPFFAVLCSPIPSPLSLLPNLNRLPCANGWIPLFFVIPFFVSLFPSFTLCRRNVKCFTA